MDNQNHEQAMRSKAGKQAFARKPFVSLVLLLTVGVAVLSGGILYIAPQGRIAHWTDWRVAGLAKEQWSAVHINASLLFALAVAVHVAFHWQAMIRYLSGKLAGTRHQWRELLAAISIVLLVVAGTLWHTPPLGTVIDLNDRVKSYWAKRSDQPPVPHAEELSLAELGKVMGISAEQVMETLAGEGLPLSDAYLSVQQAGLRWGLAPAEVYAVLLRHHPQARSLTNPSGQCGAKKGACRSKTAP